MTPSHRSQISEELLSLYLDGEVNPQEGRQVEEALAADPEIAWQLASLRHTVDLLHELPAIALPQTFALPEALVADVVAARRAAHRSSVQPRAAGGGAWHRLLAFLGGGNLLLRNAAAVTAMAFFVLVAGDLLGAGPNGDAFQPVPMAAPQIAQIEMADEPAPAFMAEAPSLAPEIAPEAESEILAAKALAGEEPNPPTQDAFAAAQDPLAPDPAAALFGVQSTQAGEMGGGAGGADGMGGGAEIGPPGAEPLPMAAALAEAAPTDVAPAAELQRMAPQAASAEAAVSESPTSASVAASPMLAEAESAPVAVAVEAAALAEEPALRAAPEILAEPAPAAASSAPSSAPFSPLRLAQLGLGVLAVLLSGLWVRSQ